MNVLRSRAFTAVFMLCAALGLGRELYRHVIVERGAHWARVDARYTDLRKALKGTPDIGYVTDEPLEATPGKPGSHAATTLYQQAQYALAPTVVRYDDLSPALVLGNFVNPASAAHVAADHQLTPVRDFGDGVVLYRHQ